MNQLINCFWAKWVIVMKSIVLLINLIEKFMKTQENFEGTAFNLDFKKDNFLFLEEAEALLGFFVQGRRERASKVS